MTETLATRPLTHNTKEHSMHHLASFFLALWLLQSATALASADIIFLGNNIVTVDQANAGADAVAVKGQRILAVGTEAQVLQHKGESTRVINLGDRALVPGFIDAHGHMPFAGTMVNRVNLSSPPVGTVNNIADIIQSLQAHIREKNIAPGEWVYGYGYDDSLIAEGRHPNRDDLDKVSLQHPISLMHVSGHLTAVNSKALSDKGVNENTADPAGGIIRRRPGTNQPNGVMEETAGYLFRDRTAMSNPEKMAGLIRQSVALHASYGLTTVQDGGSSLDMVRLFRDMAEREAFSVDVVAFPVGNRMEVDTLDGIQAEKNYNNGFRLGGIKFLLDGSPQGRTAFLSKPYTKGPPGAAEDYRAYLVYPAEEYERRVAGLIRRGVPVLAHANGDGAIDTLIQGVNKAVEGIEMPDHRTVIIHAQLTREDQLHQIKQLGLVPSYFAAHPFFWGDWHRQSFGEERAAFISPVARTAELGIPFTVHNDAPIVPPDMMRLMWVTVNRKTRSGFVLGPDQRATPMQALHAVTLGAAYQYFEEATKGSITTGKQADLVILGANPLTVEPDGIKDIPVLETFARGRSIYRAESDPGGT